MRKIKDVTDELLKIFPKDYPTYNSFVKGVDWVLESDKYRAPEDKVANFEQFQSVMTLCIPSDLNSLRNNSWMVKAWSIWTTLPETKILK